MAALDLFEPLEAHEIALVHELKAAVAPTVAKHPELRVFCNDWCYVRYLRARQWSLPKAARMLSATLQWRVEAAPHAIGWESVQAEAASGKNFVSPFPDLEGRPVVTMRPRNQNTGDERAQVQFLIYCLEHASRLADAQRVGKMTWLIDFVGYSMRNAPSVRTSIEVLHILQNHYPERLGCAVCYSAPSLFSLTWKAVSPFIDPVTKKKVDFAEKTAPGAAAAAAAAAAAEAGRSAAAAAAAAPPGTLAAHFRMEHVESCMGGRYEGQLFDLQRYRARMMAEDAEVARAVAAAAAGLPAPEPSASPEPLGGGGKDGAAAGGALGAASVSISSSMSEMSQISFPARAPSV
ncbi:hypothetical protein Rsub_10896 [Raphidocelis subcapitata]|uniref:CRAL-TRIO domain-containing protein n=1 Tax=Raphidocelis subcapitata TaxID=307507 RepID=A0A2V0PFG4_9CHLO|nr:hypothetical protein Rsub_10896 [Raphidocelis subcapitata]|eukprot:GBF97732.1 hypothetical protein Rsub_10896 [Raphidocelis subcapitata]